LDYEDGNAMLYAAKLGLPGHIALINVGAYNRIYGFGRDQIYAELKNYANLSQEKGIFLNNICSLKNNVPFFRNFKMRRKQKVLNFFQFIQHLFFEIFVFNSHVFLKILTEEQKKCIHYFLVKNGNI
jgi:hypothetical protein